MLYEAIFKIGQRFRNPSLQSCFEFLKKTEQWNRKELEAYQLEQLKVLVTQTYTHSSYYKKKMDALAVAPSAIETLDDLKKLPIITKQELIEFNSEIHTNLSFEKKFEAATSGSSGESLKFQREEPADSFNRASIFRGYSWYNVKPWERNGYFWGYNFSKLAQLKSVLLDVLQNRFRVFSFKPKKLNKFLNKLGKAQYLHGYSSMIYEVAKFINNSKGDQNFNLKMVKGTSEKIYESYQDEVQKAFGVKMISEYGAAETGIIAFECLKGNMHINMEGVIVEELDHEIIVTNLQLKSFPIIRYRLGDYIRLAPKEKECSCGMEHQILEEVTGRIGTLVYGENQTYPSLYFYYIFKNLLKNSHLMLTYQVHQGVKGQCEILIEQGLTNNDLQLIEKEIFVYFKDDISFTIKQNASLLKPKGKLKNFISTI